MTASFVLAILFRVSQFVQIQYYNLNVQSHAHIVYY